MYNDCDRNPIEIPPTRWAREPRPYDDVTPPFLDFMIGEELLSIRRKLITRSFI